MSIRLYVDPSGALTWSESVTRADSPGRPGSTTRSGDAELLDRGTAADLSGPERAATTAPTATARTAPAVMSVIVRRRPIHSSN
ncbi:hypothetical protein Ari01nite_37080 [Paractinoplanes rishiriensis]|uniref:Uncharacterized protein n=1 Tax=Paractinoplanes rishiriensis TaxID=1050105 RepID=A0A919K042_9ACTN|nr:hypothetical protein Ari01nite_37080 [Actinoplanes rishiriensis]